MRDIPFEPDRRDTALDSRLVPWIPFVVPGLALFLALAVLLIEASVL